MQKLMNLLNSEAGSIIGSILLGLGAATLFRKTCGDHCVIIRAPDINDLKQYMYEMDGTCYKYSPKAVECSAATPSPDTQSPAHLKPMVHA